ncbi:MAG: hypothetical protein B6I32_01215 [Desulfobacterium sp. 4572_20]|nr:MAG: hypothetical protein B6I32_01215 [Desulfobacterium sp. 4572_20]
MIKAKLWFTCAAMHDPVTPIIVKPSVLGWKAKKRDVELTIERVIRFFWKRCRLYSPFLDTI